MDLENCPHCGTNGILVMSDGRCPNCKKIITEGKKKIPSPQKKDTSKEYKTNIKQYNKTAAKCAGEGSFNVSEGVRWCISFLIAIPAGFVCFVIVMFIKFVGYGNMSVSEFIRRILIQFSSGESIMILAVICGFIGISIQKMNRRC